jgi:serine/threonine protein kinase
MICELGRGSYGVVNKVISLVDNNEYVMKKINMKHIKLKHQKEALKEAQILRKVKHPNIIRNYGICRRRRLSSGNLSHNV